MSLMAHQSPNRDVGATAALPSDSDIALFGRRLKVARAGHRQHARVAVGN
jgi:hypothetical protein